MIIDDNIRDEKIQYDMKKVSSSGEINKYYYFTGEEKLSSNQRQIIEQAKFAYSLLVKAF